MNKKVFEFIKQIPKGKVVTYKQVAQVTELNSPRLVGKILHNNPSPDIYPCHRVIKSDGKIATGFAFGGPGKQKELLEKEGIIFNNDKIDLKVFGFLS